MTELPWHRPAGTLQREGETVHLTAQDAGWAYSGLRVLTLSPGESRTISLDGVEAAIIPLAAQRVSLTIASEDELLEATLAGRAGVFAQVSDWAYAPVGASVTLSAPDGGEIAVATAVAEIRFPAGYIPATGVPIEIRGAGSATRQVNNIGHPAVFTGAHRLVLCELLTPDGNWSSYPPHRHDGIGDCEWTNEEIYYFRIGQVGSDHGVPHGIGYHRTYTAPEDPGPPVDITVEIGDGDVFLVPRGYHGPSIAAPGYPMYYLNILAGPGDRTMNFCDDPTHHWIRESWSKQTVDPRVPMSSHTAPSSERAQS